MTLFPGPAPATGRSRFGPAWYAGCGPIAWQKIVTSLDRLLHPLPVSDFLESLGQGPFLRADRSATELQELLDHAALEAILANYGPAPKHAVRLAKADGDPASIWFENEAPDLARIRDALANGYTLNVNDLADRHPRLRSLSADLCCTLGANIRCNAFLTPAGAKAFPAHFDPHEVLILQLEGAKRWRVFRPQVEAPTPETVSDRTVDPDAVGPPVIDHSLQAGELLVIPRGYGHEAHCEDASSLHLTIAIHFPTWADVLARLVAETANVEPLLRRALPPGAVFGARGDEVRKGLAQALGALDGNLEATLCALGVETLADHPGPTNPSLTGEVSPVDADTLLARRADAFGLSYQRGGRTGLQWPGMRVEGPPEIRVALDYIRWSDGPFRTSDLPGLSAAERIRLAGQLLDKGVLTLVEGGTGPCKPAGRCHPNHVSDPEITPSRQYASPASSCPCWLMNP